MATTRHAAAVMDVNEIVKGTGTSVGASTATEMAKAWANAEKEVAEASEILSQARRSYEESKSKFLHFKENLGSLVNESHRQRFVVLDNRVIKIEFRSKNRNSVSWTDTVSE
jgi:hypothetical protein